MPGFVLKQRALTGLDEFQERGREIALTEVSVSRDGGKCKGSEVLPRGFTELP